jgi:hypothetical protein
MFDTVPAEWVAEYQRFLSGEGPDQRAGASESATTFSHYVMTSDGAKVRLLVGPFASALEAEQWVLTSERLLLENKLVNAAKGVRLTRLLGEPALAPRGELNSALGVG